MKGMLSLSTLIKAFELKISSINYLDQPNKYKSDLMRKLTPFRLLKILVN